MEPYEEPGQERDGKGLGSWREPPQGRLRRRRSEWKVETGDGEVQRGSGSGSGSGSDPDSSTRPDPCNPTQKGSFAP